VELEIHLTHVLELGLRYRDWEIDGCDWVSCACHSGPIARKGVYGHPLCKPLVCTYYTIFEFQQRFAFPEPNNHQWQQQQHGLLWRKPQIPDLPCAAGRKFVSLRSHETKVACTEANFLLLMAQYIEDLHPTIFFPFGGMSFQALSILSSPNSYTLMMLLHV
jgi:hypothetical protein